MSPRGRPMQNWPRAAAAFRMLVYGIHPEGVGKDTTAALNRERTGSGEAGDDAPGSRVRR